MLTERLEEVLEKHSFQLPEVIKSDIISLLSKQARPMDTIDKTIFEDPVNLQNSNTKAPLDETLHTSEQSTETLFFDDVGEEFAASLEGYDDLGELGVGGMGEVRKIRDRTLNRTLAMKIIHPQMLSHHHLTSRFIEEAQIGAQLQHPNIIPIHEMGRLNDGRLYFTMKEVKGRPFGEAIAEVHAAIENKRWQTTESGWSLRRLIDAFMMSVVLWLMLIRRAYCIVGETRYYAGNMVRYWLWIGVLQKCSEGEIWQRKLES